MPGQATARSVLRALNALNILPALLARRRQAADESRPPRGLAPVKRLKRRQLLQSAGLLMPAPKLAPALSLRAAERPEPLYQLPFATPPGPSTWYVEQWYGNTNIAYRLRNTVYYQGQGLHFGIDFACPCETEVRAIGDGVVVGADDLSYGAGPHNAIVQHPNGDLSLYGHLRRFPAVRWGQAVAAGELIGYSGDWLDNVGCAASAHLHLEIRRPNRNSAVNPAPLIKADWHNLALGRFLGFVQDLDDPRRWQTLEDQPDTTFGGRVLNDYARLWMP